MSILLLIVNNSSLEINVKRRRIPKNTLWCLVELFKSFETCACLKSHDSRAVRMKNTATIYTFQKLTSRILVISKAIKVSMKSYFRVLKVPITDHERVI